MTHANGRSRALLGRALAPLRDFIHAEAAGGVVLLIATVAALVWANSPWADTYTSLWQTELRVGTDAVALEKPLQLWVNDGLMAIFFFVVGLEIKREIVAGELASPRRALVPIVGAIGGAVVPALIFLAFTVGTDASRGWGIAMATDIAFALGVLAILGRRVPVALKLFVTALAIVDDILAVLVIAFFYTADVSVEWLAAAAVLFGLLVAANRLGVRRVVVYAALGLALWLAVLQSGVHATLAGVLLAASIPASRKLAPEAVPANATAAVDRLVAAAGRDDRHAIEEREAALWELEEVATAAQSPLHRLEHALHPWTAFLIVPLFALANAGVALGTYIGAAMGSPVAYGIIAGLVIGKQAGILAATWLVVITGLGSLPKGVTWRHIWGAAWVCGIGFTMSLFIAELAFADADLLAVAKIGIFAASVVAATGGVITLLRNGAVEGRESA